MYQIEQCYDSGDLAKALEQAASFIRRIGEQRVHSVNSRPCDNAPGAWWVDVVYTVNGAK